MLITDPASAIDAIVQRTRERGIIKGSNDGCMLEYLRSGSDVREGDIVITSGKDNFYPKGILIGKIENVREQGDFLKSEYHLRSRCILSKKCW